MSGAASATATLGPITIQRQDTFNNAVTTGSTTVNMASNSTGTAAFAATSGGASITSVTIPAGQSSASFFYGDTKLGSPAITASAVGLSSAPQTEGISAANAAKLAITTAPVSGVASATANIGPITVERRDTFNNPVTGGSTIVNLSSNTAGTAIFAATSGGAGITQVTIPNGVSTTTFHYGDTKPGTSTVTAASSGLTSSTLSATISPLPATKLVFTTNTLSGEASATATVGPITVQRQDVLGNAVSTGSTALTLSSNSVGTKIFATASGGSGTSSVTIPDGSSTVSFFYGDTKAGSPNITVSGLGTPITQAETITAAAPAKLVFVAQPSDVFTGVSMSPAVTVQVQDQFGNNKAAAIGVSLALSSGSVAAGGTATSDGTGLATFNAAKINTPGLGLTMTASATGLTVAGPSNPFNVSLAVQNGAKLTDTVIETGSGLKSVAYYYCSGFTGSCTSSNWTLIGTAASGTAQVTWTNHTLINGPYRVFVFATDNLDQVSSPSSPLPVTLQNTPVVVTTSSLPAGKTSTAYSTTLGASGGVAPYTWTWTGGTLPAGLGLTASTGEISGTPTTVGTSSDLIFQVTDVNGLTNSSSALSIAVTALDSTPPVLTVTSATEGDDVAVSNGTVRFRTNDGTDNGNFTVTVSDPETGITTSNFPSLTGWTISGSGNSRTYALNNGANPSTATLDVGATNGAGTSVTLPLSVTLDNTAPGFTGDVVRLFNGGTAGRADAGDSLVVTFNEVLDAQSLFSGWENDGTIQTETGITVRITNNSSSDTFADTSNSFLFGSVDLNANYVSSSSTTFNATITWDPGTKKLTFLLGSVTGSDTRNSSISSSTPTYSPNDSITDLVGNGSAPATSTGRARASSLNGFCNRDRPARCAGRSLLLDDCRLRDSP